MYFIPMKFKVADREVAIKNAIIKELFIWLVNFNTISFDATLTIRVDKYNRVKTVNLKNPPMELWNV